MSNNVFDSDVVDSELFTDLSAEELESITGGGWFGRIVGGVVGGAIGVAIGWPSTVGVIGSGAIGAGIGAAWGDSIEEDYF
jgi:uncharacterized protein YcfJ